MHQRNPKAPRRQIVSHRRRNVVRRVSADNRGEEGPGAEGAGGEGVGVGLARGGFGVVELGCVGGGAVGLEAVCG